jgi:hypothetical protein
MPREFAPVHGDMGADGGNKTKQLVPNGTAKQNAPRQPQSRPRLLVNSAKTES